MLRQCSQTTDARGWVIGYTYEAAGNETVETYPDNGGVTECYDGARRVTQVAAP